MVCYIVIFEIAEPTRLTAFKKELRNFSGCCPLTDQAWAIATDKTAVEVRDKLASFMLPAEKLFVFRSGTVGAWRNAYTDAHNEWLKKNL